MLPTLNLRPSEMFFHRCSPLSRFILLAMMDMILKLYSGLHFTDK